MGRSSETLPACSATCDQVTQIDVGFSLAAEKVVSRVFSVPNTVFWCSMKLVKLKDAMHDLVF
jgi:hypothetical protein